MNTSDKYSDEYINAYIDGELNDDECACILFDEQENVQLAKRVNEVRNLKEKVKLAFPYVSDKPLTNNSSGYAAFFNRHRALVAGLFILSIASTIMMPYIIGDDKGLVEAKQLIANTQPLSANMISSAIGTNKHVVIHVSKYQQNQFGEIINTIESLLKQKSTDGSFSLELVANGQGLKVLDTTSSIFAERLSALAQRFDSFEVIACAKSLAKLVSEGDPVQLMTAIIITPSAAQRVAKRTEQGWLYLKV